MSQAGVVDEPIFSFYMGNVDTDSPIGMLTLGGVNQTHYEGQAHFGLALLWSSKYPDRYIPPRPITPLIDSAAFRGYLEWVAVSEWDASLSRSRLLTVTPHLA